MTPVIVIRPQPGCDDTIAAAAELGLDAQGFPLFEVRPLPWDTPDPDSIDALLFGSANALRHGSAALLAFTGKPAYAVGEKTAEAARNAGFEVAATGEGGLQQVLDKVQPGHRRLLRLAGAERVELAPADGIEILERSVYSSDPVPMPAELAALLRKPAVVLLHSAAAARHFASSCEARSIDRSQITLAAIGPRVAEAASRGWRALRVADQPNDGALLALARQICEETGRSPDTRKEVMQDQTGFQSMLPLPIPEQSGRRLLTVAVLAFVLGAALVGWTAWRGYLNEWIPGNQAKQNLAAVQPGEDNPDGNEALQSESNERNKLAAVSSVEARLAMLEDRFSRLNLQANAASGNAARAESLLIAFAARRMIDRGEPLRYLADQLQLRFSNAQPRAVKTIVDFAERPVTMDELSARLDALSPQLAGGSNEESFWDAAMREISGLFTVRRENAALLSPEARIERARVMLRAGKIPEAVDQIERLPNPEAAATWIADAKRYAAVQESLDLIETTAMLEPSRLQDAEGNRVDQPSPLATPTEAPDAKPQRKP